MHIDTTENQINSLPGGRKSKNIFKIFIVKD